MVRGASRPGGRELEAIFDGGAAAGLSDRQLLDRFNDRRDAAGEAAFATVVRRHGPMVLEICRRHLGDPHRAEDAFQAVFLVLARKAGSLRDPDLLGPWLHGVAVRTARKSRGRRDRDRRREGEAPMLRLTASPTAEEAAIDRERVEALHLEIERLPEAFRLPVLLCYFEGLTLDEAARRLRWPAGTLRSRLARAREKIRRGLDRRGVAIAAVAAAAILDRPSAAAPVPAALVEATARAAIRFAGGTAAAGPAATTAAEMLRSMAIARAAVGIGLAAIAAGVGWLGASPAIKSGPVAARPGPVAVATAAAIAVTQEPPARPTSPTPNPSAPSDYQPPPVRKPGRRPSAWGEPVDRAILHGARFLKSQQFEDGSWPDVDGDAKSGMTSLAVLALLAAGESADSPQIRKALERLRALGPDDFHSTYAVALQVMAFAAASPARDRARIVAGARWLERAQIRADDRVPWPGTWTYSDSKAQAGDHSNTQYALLGLNAAREAGVTVRPGVWALSRAHFERAQLPNGGWSYTPRQAGATGSMTCAGLSSLALCELRRYEGRETIQDGAIRGCGEGSFNRDVMKGLDWMATHFRVDENVGQGQGWRYYYLYGLERAGRLSGARYIGTNDWYRVGVEELLREQDRISGAWRGGLMEKDPILTTCFALLFLGRGRAPVLIQKARHAPLDDWNRDPGDVAHLVEAVARDWKVTLDWQSVDLKSTPLPELLRTPILVLNGHRAPALSFAEKSRLRDYVDGGGTVFAEACCGEADFDRGFRELMREVFAEEGSELRPIPEDHPVYRSRFAIESARDPLWGIRRGDRMAVIYSPKDLSCYWNQADRVPADPAIIRALRIGRNVIDYATGRQLPPDKLEAP